MMQKEIMMQGGGDAWLNRNRGILGQKDEVAHVIPAYIRKQPTCILEVGCANGWRLAKLRALYGSRVHGVDPSMEAGIEAAELKVPVHQMTASCLPVIEGGFDLIIYGFCLYLTDPSDWLLIASEGDRALSPGGHIIVHDFGDFDPVHSVPYAHDARMVSWHFDWARLWLAHPAYTMIHRHWTTGNGHPDQQAVTILQKRKL